MNILEELEKYRAIGPVGELRRDVKEMAELYVGECDGMCTGDPSVGISPCPAYLWPDIEKDTPGGCRFAKYKDLEDVGAEAPEKWPSKPLLLVEMFPDNYTTAHVSGNIKQDVLGVGMAIRAITIYLAGKGTPEEEIRGIFERAAASGIKQGLREAQNRKEETTA